MILDRIIIGAGIAGLLAAKRASDRGEKILVLDKNERSGGAVASTTIAGLTMDSGAESFSISSAEVEKLIVELGLESFLTEPSGLSPWIVSSAERYKIPQGFFGIPMSLDDPELLQIVGSAAIDEARKLDSQPIGELGSIAQLISSRLGAVFLERIIRPVVAGVHGTDPEALSVEAVMPPLAQALKAEGSLVAAAARLRASAKRPGVAVKSLKGGMFRLIDALVEDLAASGVVILQNQNVISLSQQENSWLVRTATSELSSSQLTLAAGGNLMELIEPTIKKSKETDLLAGSAAVGVVVVHAKSKSLNAHPLGTGGLIRIDSGWQTKATTHINAKWDWVQKLLAQDEHLLRFSYGRNGSLPNGLSDLAASEMAEIYQVEDAVVLETREIVWPDSLVRLSSSLREEFENLEVCGSYVSGNGLLGIVKDHYERKAA